MMGSSIDFTFSNTIFFGKVMKQLEFVLFNRGILFTLDCFCHFIAYHWYDANEYPFNVIQYIAIFYYFLLPLVLTSTKR